MFFLAPRSVTRGIIKAAGGNLLLQKESGKKSQQKRTESKCGGSVMKITSQKKVKLPWCSRACGGLGPLRIRFLVPYLKRWLNSMMTVSSTLTPHARIRFETLALKYLYQEIFVNFCLVLISTHNHLRPGIAVDIRYLQNQVI